MGGEYNLDLQVDFRNRFKYQHTGLSGGTKFKHADSVKTEQLQLITVQFFRKL